MDQYKFEQHAAELEAFYLEKGRFEIVGRGEDSALYLWQKNVRDANHPTLQYEGRMELLERMEHH